MSGPPGPEGSQGIQGLQGVQGLQGIPGPQRLDTYDNEKTYELNSPCVYGGLIFRCTSPITTPEVWTPAHWQQLSFPEFDNLFIVVATLPASGVANKIYLVPSGESGSNQFVEWAWISGAWENLGNVTIDLSGYYTKEEIDAIFISTINGRHAVNGVVDVTVDMTEEDFQALEDPPGSGLYPSLKGQIVRRSDVEPYDGVLIEKPNIRTSNRITVPITGNNQQWTATDDGIVTMKITFSSVPNASGDAYVLRVNGCGVEGSILFNSSSLFEFSANVEVAKDDVILLTYAASWTASYIEVSFYPNKWVLRRPPIQVIEGNGSYSTDEIDTGQIWYNGKPIYRRVFTGTFNMSGGTVRDTIVFASGATWLDCVINSGGWVEASSGNHARCAINSRMVQDGAALTSYVIESCVRFTSGTTLQMNLSGANPIVGGLYECWVEYTKL
jgi:hypothetical protein